MSTHNQSSTDNMDFLATRVGLAQDLVVFNRFQLQRILGRGGMGVVWLAEDQQYHRQVAVKFMPDIVAADATAVQDLRRETRNGLRLTHKNIVRMYDLVEENDSAAIIMEFVKGSNLADMRLKQQEQVFEAASLEKYVHQLLDALEHAHSEVGLIHRDLKPANLMVNDNDDLKVADFGIARNLKDTVSRVSVKASSSGTLVYMSPQQLLGEMPCPADDIYALGATLYELLTGKPPFYSGDIATQVDSKVPPRIAERRAEFGVNGDPIPENWEIVIAACLEKSPKNRPVDMEAIRQGLKGQKFKRGSGDWKSRSGATTRGKATAQPASSSFTMKAAAAVVLLSGAGWYFGLHAPAQAKRERALQATKSSVTVEDEEKRALADVDLQMFETDVKELRAAADQLPSKRALRMTWEALQEKLMAFEHPYSDRDKELKEEVSRLLNRAESEEEDERDDYRKAIDEVKAEMLTLKEQDKRTDLSATVKRDAWRKLLESFKARGLDEVYGEDHIKLQEETNQVYVTWLNEAIKETPAEPVPFPQVLSANYAASWPEKDKKEKYKAALAALKRENLYMGKPDGDTPAIVHESILAFQRRESLPANGLLDDATLTRLKVDSSRPVTVSASSGGGGSRSSSGSSGGGSSGGSSGGGAANWLKYIPAGSGPRPPFGRPF